MAQIFKKRRIITCCALGTLFLGGAFGISVGFGNWFFDSASQKNVGLGIDVNSNWTFDENPVFDAPGFYIKDSTGNYSLAPKLFEWGSGQGWGGTALDSSNPKSDYTCYLNGWAPSQNGTTYVPSYYVEKVNGVFVTHKCVSLGGSAYVLQSPRVVVPDTYNQINSGIFCETARYHYQSISLPNTITSIGNQAFKEIYCDSFNWPTSLKTIGDEAFFRTTISTNLNLSATKLVSIGNSAFYQSGLTSFEAASTLTSIGDSAFKANSLASVDFGSTVIANISGQAFADQTGWSFTATLPSTMTTCGAAAFNNSFVTVDIALDSRPSGFASNWTSYNPNSWFVNVYWNGVLGNSNGPTA